VSEAGLTLTNVPRIHCGEHRMLRQLAGTTDRVRHQAEPAEVHLYFLCGAREYAAPDPPAVRLPLAAAVCTSDWFRIIAARAGRCFFLPSSREEEPIRVMGRIDRQRVLYDEGKRFRFVMPEAVLRWPYGPPDDPAVFDEHREQLALVEWARGRPNVEVGILPGSPCGDMADS
jgi:hypothetical protein